jgi:hypothetical protein
MTKIMKILDEEKAVLLSLMTFLGSGNGDYTIILRIKSDDPRSLVRELKSSGFNVTSIR